MTLTKADLAERLCSKMELNKQLAKLLVDLLFEEIRTALEQGHEIKLSGFGNFNIKDKCQRPGRNPKTGEDVAISPRRVVTFRSGLKLRAILEAKAQNLLNGES